MLLHLPGILSSQAKHKQLKRRPLTFCYVSIFFSCAEFFSSLLLAVVLFPFWFPDHFRGVGEQHQGASQSQRLGKLQLLRDWSTFPKSPLLAHICFTNFSTCCLLVLEFMGVWWPVRKMDHTINTVVYCTDELPSKYPNTRGKNGLIITAVGPHCC